MAYKINFTEKELNIFNTIERQSKKESLMSIYSYLLKHSNKESNTLEISFNKLYNMYIRYHKQLGFSTLKKRVNTLKELGLIVIEKNSKGVNKYLFTKFTIADNVADNVANKKCAETVEITTIEEELKIPKYLNLSYIDNDIDSNNNSNTNNEFKTLEKVNDKSIVINRAKELLKELKVKSSWIKKAVLDKLSKYYSNITIKYLDSYICKVIMQIRAISVTNFNNLVLSKKNKKTLRFNDYEQRVYDYNALENQLLGIDPYDESVLTNAEESTHSNNNTVVNDILSALA